MPIRIDNLHRRRAALAALCSCVLLLTADGAVRCQPQEVSFAADPPPLGRVVRVFDSATGDELDLDGLWQRLGGFDAVFLGETHIDETTHRVELAALEAMLAAGAAAGGRQVVLALEMFERDVQPVLDRYLRGEIDEPQFLAHARAWDNYRTGYRRLVEAAKRNGAPVVASNAPASVRRKVAFGGKAALDALSDAERAMLPPELLPNSAAYWERVARTVRGHMGGMGESDPEQLLYSTQSLWDNCMGWSCAQALERWPGSLVLHVNGGFHSAYRDGTVSQLARRRPDARIATVAIRPADDLARAGHRLDVPIADFLIYAEQRARGAKDGAHAVRVGKDLGYRLRVPDSASAAHPVPLLVWLPADGLRAEDGAEFWRVALGDEAAVAVVEAPYPQIEKDLYRGGRWFWDESFAEDAQAVTAGLERLCRYVVRNFPVDRATLVIAGEGAGATMVAAAKVFSHDLPFEGVAVAPRRHQKLGEEGLPDPRPDGVPGPGRLTVLAVEDSQGFWEHETGQYREIGVDARVEPAPADAVTQSRAGELAIRAALSLPVPAGHDGDAILVVESDSVLARHWALVRARRLPFGSVRALTTPARLAQTLRTLTADRPVRILPLTFRPIEVPEDLGSRVELLPPLRVSELEDGHALPLHPSPFGGTTVLVVPAGADERERRAWSALATSGAIQRRSRFARLTVAFEDGTPGLVEVLDRIREAGRRNALVVPAMFCADAVRMRTLEGFAGPYLEVMSIAWLPGLGGSRSASGGR